MATTLTVTGHLDTRSQHRSPVTDTDRGKTEADPTTDYRNNWPGTVNQPHIRRIRFGHEAEKTPFTDHRRPGVLVHPPANSPTISEEYPGRFLPELPGSTVRGIPTTRTQGAHRTRHPTSRSIPDTNGRCYRPITTFRPGHWPIGPGNRVPQRTELVGE